MSLIDHNWIALNIGNSRLHWALFKQNQIQEKCDTPHIHENSVISLSEPVPSFVTHPISLDYQSIAGLTIDAELWIASVVPEQFYYWRDLPNSYCIDLDQIPLRQLYPTLGVDRALALWGAIQRYGSPALVIDCGTAMTFTGANGRNELIGGAIVPGVRLQFQALEKYTAALPMIETVETLPNRWARDTKSAIESGILNTLLAGVRSFIEDWHQQVGESAIVLTGGDANLMYSLLASDQIQLDLDLVFWGMRSIRNLRLEGV
ncbi:pantothenate kinase [Leptolyngbya sp. AN03gr2]|uniref:pantothenate kinase n=1 Tax=unclassified Leptolyngbya TaxID=2650499 RepID=UPI003D316074